MRATIWLMVCVAFCFFVAGWFAARGRWDWLASIAGLWAFVLTRREFRAPPPGGHHS